MASTPSKTKPRAASKPAVKTAARPSKQETSVTPAAEPVRPAPRAAAVPAATPDEFRSEVPEMLSNSEVYDEADQAQWIQLAEQASFRERARVANAPETHPDFDGQHCIDCGNEIPEARLQLFKIRCVECQRVLEAKRRQFA